jgi:hypothetical protein
MTFKEMIQEYMKETIYFDRDIEDIMAGIESEIHYMKGRWNDDINGYPESVIICINLNVDIFVLEWLKKWEPKHFLIPYFEEKVHGTSIPEVEK